MTTYTKANLSGSTDGKFIKIDQTNISSGTTIHTADASAIDEIWIYAQNTTTSGVKLTLGWGGTSSPDDIIEVTLPGEAGLFCVVPGLTLTNSKIVKGAASEANVIMIGGYVNRIT